MKNLILNQKEWSRILEDPDPQTIRAIMETTSAINLIPVCKSFRFAMKINITAEFETMNKFRNTILATEFRLCGLKLRICWLCIAERPQDAHFFRKLFQSWLLWTNPPRKSFSERCLRIQMLCRANFAQTTMASKKRPLHKGKALSSGARSRDAHPKFFRVYFSRRKPYFYEASSNHVNRLEGTILEPKTFAVSSACTKASPLCTRS